MNESTRRESVASAGNASVVNGVNVETLMGTIDAIKGDPGLGSCHFRASNTWLSGNHNRSTVSGFYAARQEIAHKQKFTMEADEPALLAGGDDGANPVEHLLHALAACTTTSMVAHATVRGIRIEALESEVEGDLDLRGFLGLSSDVPKGLTEIRVKFRVKANPRDLKQIEELAKYSPVFDSLTRGTRVAVSVEQR
jgi:uncharacterized OsmC-like protein